MNILKVGGSILAPKGEKPHFREEVLLGIISQFSGSPPDILVHGAGAYGHNIASRLKDTGDIACTDVREIRRMVSLLTDCVTATLERHGLDYEPMSPGKLLDFDNGRVISQDGLKAISSGRLLTWGDVVLDSGMYRIYSGDEAVADLVKRLDDVDRVVFATAVPGVLDGTGRVMPEVTAPPSPGGPDDDVTGAMRGKVLRGLEISKSGPEVRIVSGTDGESVAKALRGEPAGTRVVFK